VAAVQKFLFQGDAYFRTGQYDKAEETYSKILLLDPYNKAAREKMSHIERYRTRAEGFRHEEYELAAMEKVAHDWSEEISPDIAAPPTQISGPTSISNRAEINRKLQSIIIDKVNFEKLDIAAVIQFLQDKSKELDPDHQGINFVLRLTTEQAPTPEQNPATAPSGAAAPAAPPATATTIHREVSITLTDVPLSEVLGYITQQTNLQATVEDYAVYLRPSIDEGETLTVRTFLVPPAFFPGGGLHVTIGATTDTAPTTVNSLIVDAKQQLIDKGIRFPAGAAATFLPGSSKLVVRNTPEQLDLIENLIGQLAKETPQVQIEAKLAEFNQDAIKALSFNYIVGSNQLGPTPNTNTGGVNNLNVSGAQTALRTSDNVSATGLGGLTPDGISELIQQNTASSGGFTPLNQLTGGGVENNTPNILVVGGVVDGYGLAATMEALNNLQGVSLLSAPSVTTQNGLKANIDIVREFPYPTSFEKPKLSANANIAYSQPGPFFNLPLILAIPPTPREFVTQDVGVSLEVKPTTYPDQRIDLDLSKCQVLDFDGFIDYGVPIVARQSPDTPPPNEPGTVVTSGTINQPVFNLRSIVTTLQVLDGQTAVLGGLMREDTQEVNDKVPVLGDVPLLGRLFQSKVSERTKKNLLLFITARLIRTNGKPQYVKTLEAEPTEEALPEPAPIGNGVTLPMLPEGTPNS
jgi:general secretion pathway protein D